MRKVLIIQELVPHYRLSFFLGLITECSKNGVMLVIAHGKERDGTAPRSVGPGALPPENEIWIKDQRHWFGVTIQPLNLSEYWDLIIMEFAIRHAIGHRLQLLKTTRVISSKIAYWGHSHNPKNKKSPIELLKRLNRNWVDHWFAYTDEVARNLIGYPTEKTTVVNNSIDTKQLSRHLANIAQRIEKDPNNCLVLGSLRADKRLPFLIAEAKRVLKDNPDATIDIVGDGPDRELATIWANEQPTRVKYHGHLEGEDLAKILWKSSVILNPGLVGLVVLDSFVARSPIITTDNDGHHSPEFAYILNGVNGVISKDSPGDYSLTVLNTLRDAAHLEKLRKGCELYASRFTIESMIENFAAGILKCIHESSPRV